MFIKHGSPEPITCIYKSSDETEDLDAEKALSELKNKMAEETKTEDKDVS